MASTSGSGASATRYDVFLSFRGPDTRNNFTDCLYRTMVGQGIVAYRDSEELHAGDRIDDLLRAVGNSKICIPVFSRGYASSPWCLRELARMMELKESTGKPEILPIFFDVSASDVKLKTKLYVEDLQKYEQRPGGESKEQWEAALGKVGKIVGWEVQGKPHGEVIDLVVREVLRKLEVKQRPLDSKLVGVDEQVEAIIELLDVDSGTGVRFVGLYGMSGIGKTTLAKSVFNALCPHFASECSFIENIRESSIRIGLEGVQKLLASDISDSRFVKDFSNTDEGIDSIKRRAGSKKVLIVLDDLDKKEQLKKLVGGPDTFGSGSRIIITTRDKTILDEEEGILPYEVMQMDCDKALELFSLHAFNSASPPHAYQSLSRDIASTTGGLPLALVVIGSSLRGKEIKIWKAVLKKLKKVPHKDVLDKLKISYDALENDEKEIFLDIACFSLDYMNYMDYKSRATYFWEACDLYPDIALEKLTDLCLIKIVDGSPIWMHDQLIDLGRYIVCQEYDTNLTGRSRLWNGKEALEVVRSKQRKDKLRALNLSGHPSDPIDIVDEELERMPNLKFLKLRAGTFVGDINNYLQKLRWLSWASPPLDCRMANLHLKNLTVFVLSDNENTDSWGGWHILKMENTLKVLSLSRCKGLTRTPDFSGCLSLERLFLYGCPILQEVDCSIGNLKGLTHLDIIQCKNLQTLPEEIGGLENLKHFSVFACYQMKELPYSVGKLASLLELKLSFSQITSLPDSIGNAKHLTSLNLSYTPIVALPISIGELTQLEFLSLDNCENLKDVPESIGSLSSLQKLYLSGTSIVELPDSIKNLKQLKEMRIEFSAIRRLPVSIGMLERLEELYANSCVLLAGELPTEIGNLSSLRILNISSTHVRAVPTAINSLTRLQKLYLRNCNELQELPKLPLSLNCLHVHLTSLRLVPNLSNLTNLVELDLNLTDCNELQELPKLPLSLNCLRVHLTSLRLVPDLSNLANLVELDLSNGFWQAPAQASNRMQILQLQWVGKLSKLEKLSWGLSDVPVPSTELGCLPRLRELTSSGMNNFDSVIVGPEFSHLKNLSRLCLYRSPLREIQLHGLELLTYLAVEKCEFLEKLSIISSSLRKLREMEVARCPKLLEIRFLSTMGSLEKLQVGHCDSLGGLCLSNSKNLKSLWILSCNGLRVVEGLEELELLHHLFFLMCGSLEWLTDVSNSKIPNECRIDVLHCRKSLNTDDGIMSYREYKEMILERTRKASNEEDEVENDSTDCFICVLEFICKPLRFFQGTSPRRQTG